MDNLQLQHRVADLETALKSVKHHIENIPNLNQIGDSPLTFEDGFNHAMNLVKGTVKTFINPQLDKA